MNMYLVQTVSSRPRPWSSYTNINSKEQPTPVRMNSAEEISKYNDHNSHYCSPVLARRTGGTSYDFPEKSTKKDKKWSLGSLFRRKKKAGSDSSSEEETESKHFLQKKKKKSDKRKRTNKAIGFDHVVVPRNTALTNGYKSHEDSLGILSEPSYAERTLSTKNFIPASDFTSRLVPLKGSEESLDRNGLTRSNNSLGSPSVSSLGGRRKKEVVKARAEARRDTSKGDESSDEDSQLSAFKSDESLTKQRDGSLSRRSRAARTQRYLKRRSKDEEFRDPLRACKSDVEHDHSRNVQHLRLPDERMQNIKSASKSPILSTTPKSKLCYTNSAPSSRPNLSGLSTIPPSHSRDSKYRTISLTNASLYKQSSSFHDYNGTGNTNKCAPADFNNQRSLSCDANIHNAAPSPENESEVVHVQFPLGKPFNKRPNMVINQHLNLVKKQPPPPPPRDPRRILSVQNSDGRPISYSFENGYQPKNGSDQQLNVNKPQAVPEATTRNFNLNPNCRSTSEDHISWEPSQRTPLVPRPSSTTPEATRLQKLSRTLPNTEQNPNGYRYLTDKNPRSRKPICIQPFLGETAPQDNSHKPFDFWKQKDEEVSRWNTKKSTPGSPLMFTSQTHVRTNIFLPNGVKVETEPPTVNSSESLMREASPFRPITPTKSSTSSLNTEKKETPPKGSLEEADLMQRKSSNLEDALDELEAIYNSLHLGDEDLLERAEQREAAAAQKRRDAAFESFPNSVATRGAVSDSSFGYDPNFDSSRRKRYLKKAEPDRKADDMAFRKLNKERYNTISDPQSVVSRVSYLLTSPVFNTPVEEQTQKPKSKSKEPDVTLDDVVYRNVKHTNNTLKVTEPQPPFGIPVGPILPASNSDYLHATPEATQRFTFKPKKIPDVVKDDLAYRNLRKDSNKEAALPQSNFSPEDYLNNNNNNNNNKSGEILKKKRAVRSLSANIFNLMQKEWKSSNVPLDDDTDSKKQNIGDVADALEIARQILKEKETKISATRKAFLSDGELRYRKFGRSSPTEQRLNFLNEMKSSGSLDSENVYHHKLQVSIPVMDYDRLETKPPTPDRSRRGSRPSKESTPIPSSPPEDVQIKKQQSSLDDLLTSLAVEARETSERITNELKAYGEKEDNRSTDKLQELEKDAISASLNLHLSEADSSSEHAKLCEKLLECVVEGTELLATSKIEPEPSEEVGRIHIEPLEETVANIVLTPSDKSKLEINPVSTEVFSESDHDYVNIQSPDETERDLETCATENPETEVRTDSIGEVGSSTEMDEEEKELLLLDDDTVSLDICMSPLEKHKAELVAAFEELRIKDGSLKKTKSKKTHNEEGNGSEGVKHIEQTDKGGGEECVSVEYIALPTNGCVFTNESRFDFAGLNQEETERHLNVYNFDFNSGGEGDESLSLRNSDIWIGDEDALDSLKSPKLVQNLNTTVSDNQNLFGDIELSFSERQDFGVSSDLGQIFVGLKECLKGLEQTSKYPRENNDFSSVLGRDLTAARSCCDSGNKFGDSGNILEQSFDSWRKEHFGENLGKNLGPEDSNSQETNFVASNTNLDDSGQNFSNSRRDLKGFDWGLSSDLVGLDQSDSGQHFGDNLGKSISPEDSGSETVNFVASSTNLDDSGQNFSNSRRDLKGFDWGLHNDLVGLNQSDSGQCFGGNLGKSLGPEESGKTNFVASNTKLDDSGQHFSNSRRDVKGFDWGVNSDLVELDQSDSGRHFGDNLGKSLGPENSEKTNFVASSSNRNDSGQNFSNSRRDLKGFDCRLNNDLVGLDQSYSEQHFGLDPEDSGKTNFVASTSNRHDSRQTFSNSRRDKDFHLELTRDLVGLDQHSITSRKDSVENLNSEPSEVHTGQKNSDSCLNKKSCVLKSKSSGSSESTNSRDSRHTLDESRTSRSWYEDPAVIALACSCGIACTSQLPSFDIIIVLGLLFAIILLFIALIVRT